MIKYERTNGLTDVHTHYCPGCTHGILHKLVAEVLAELGVLGKTVGIASVGCSVFSYDYFNTDFQQVPHGRACATATGIKRILPTVLSLPIKVMVTLVQSVLQKRFMQLTVVKTLQRSLLTMQLTG